MIGERDFVKQLYQNIEGDLRQSELFFASNTNNWIAKNKAMGSHIAILVGETKAYYKVLNHPKINAIKLLAWGLSHFRRQRKRRSFLPKGVILYLTSDPNV